MNSNERMLEKKEIISLARKEKREKSANGTVEPMRNGRKKAILLRF
jgi:hypothetical protein